MAELRARLGKQLSKSRRLWLWLLAVAVALAVVSFPLVLGPAWLTSGVQGSLTAAENLDAKNDVRTTSFRPSQPSVWQAALSSPTAPTVLASLNR
jgi:hypothetical protein